MRHKEGFKKVQNKMKNLQKKHVLDTTKTSKPNEKNFNILSNDNGEKPCIEIYLASQDPKNIQRRVKSWPHTPQ